MESAERTATSTVTRSVTLPSTQDEAWELLTRPDDLAAWLGDEVVLDPTPGADGLVVERDGTRRRLVVEEVDTGRRLSWRWWPADGRDDRPSDDGTSDGSAEVSRVEITLLPVDGGTLVRVVEQLATSGSASLAGRASAEVRARAGEAWSHRLLHLESLLLVAAAVRG